MQFLKWLLKQTHWILPSLLLITAFSIRSGEPAWLERMQFFVFDTLMKEYPREYDTNAEIPVRIVDIDEDSLDAFGQWPWSRITMAQLIVNLRQSGAAVVAFDIVFAEPDRVSPPNAAEEWAVLEGAEGLIEQVRQLPDFDAAFAQYLEAFNPIVLGFVLNQEGRLPRIPEFDGTFATRGLDAQDVRRQITFVYDGATPNLEIFENAASGNGVFNAVPEQDGIIRRVPLIFQLEREEGIETNLYPSLAIEAFRTVQGVKTMIVRSAAATGKRGWEEGNLTGLADIKVGSALIPTDRFGRMWLHSTGRQPDRYLSAKDVLTGQFDPKLVEGAVIFVGSTAPGLMDLRSTVLHQIFPGVEIHAELAEQIIAEHYLERPGLSRLAEQGFLLLLGILLIIAMPRLGAVKSAFFGVVCIAGAFGFSWYMFIEELQLFDPVYPALSSLAVYLSGTIILFTREETERRKVRGAFGHYLSPDLVRQLEENPDKLKLGGETKVLTFLFCDVRGFTTISESFKGNPQGLTILINRFLTPLTDCILARNGTIDKYMGDCIMAFWNAPLDVPGHPKKACESALAMFEALDELNEVRRGEAEAEGRTFLPLNIGIGVNTGDCVVGNMGSEQRFDYSVLGDAVNLASRLEGQSKGYGVGIVIGGETRDEAQDEYATLELDRIAVKGKAEAVTIYTCLGRQDLRDSEAFSEHAIAHQSILDLYRSQNWDEAIAKLNALKGGLDGRMDGYYAMLDQRILEYRESPPPKDWDGVYVATSK